MPSETGGGGGGASESPSIWGQVVGSPTDYSSLLNFDFSIKRRRHISLAENKVNYPAVRVQKVRKPFKKNKMKHSLRGGCYSNKNL